MLYAIRGFRLGQIIQMVTDYRYLGPFSKVPKGNGVPHAIHFYFFRRFFRILQAVANALLHVTYWSRNKRGQVTFSNKLTWVFSFACYINQSLPWKQIHEQFRKILKVVNKVVFVWNRALAAIRLRNWRIANNSDHV